MEFIVYLGIGAILVIFLRLISPYVIGFVGYTWFPVAVGMRKFRSYLDIHSTALSKRVPDTVVRKLVEKSYSISRDQVPGLDHEPGILSYRAALAINATWLISCLESQEITKENIHAFALIGDDLLAACGVDSKKLKVIP